MARDCGIRMRLAVPAIRRRGGNDGNRLQTMGRRGSLLAGDFRLPMGFELEEVKPFPWWEMWLSLP
jgi:hypothetical protein